MSTEPEIPFAHKRVFGQLQKGDGVWDGTRFRKVKKEYPYVGLKQLFAIRRCEVVQPTLPGTETPAVEPPEKCPVCGGDEPCSHDFDKIAWVMPENKQPELPGTEQPLEMDE